MAGIIVNGGELKAFAFMLVTMMAIVFCFRILAPRLMTRLAPHLDAEKKGKCSVYITELIFTTAALLLIVLTGAWNPAWLLDFQNKSGSSLNKISLGELGAAWICATMYVVELSGEPHMRMSLLAHHFAFCSRVLGAVVELWLMPDVYAQAGARMVACWLWLPNTEQNVFAVMLAYRINPKVHPMLMKLSALLYMATRMFGIVISLVAFVWYLITGLQVLKTYPGKETLFAVFVLIQSMGFAVMIWAQYSSAKSQWGLAKKQSEKFPRHVEQVNSEDSHENSSSQDV